ncbi:MAG: hypothetical protein IK109_10255 [Clostridiales bacterium]|nr:hypothetical protein [Clostridiales bacterium]MBR5418391.1 hypothetical protein [Clostridiales bacterium]
MINKKVPLCLIIVLVVSSMLFTGCPKSGDDKETTKSEQEPKATTSNLLEHDTDAVNKIEGLLE